MATQGETRPEALLADGSKQAHSRAAGLASQRPTDKDRLILTCTLLPVELQTLRQKQNLAGPCANSQGSTGWQPAPTRPSRKPISAQCDEFPKARRQELHELSEQRGSGTDLVANLTLATP